MWKIAIQSICSLSSAFHAANSCLTTQIHITTLIKLVLIFTFIVFIIRVFSNVMLKCFTFDWLSTVFFFIFFSIPMWRFLLGPWKIYWPFHPHLKTIEALVLLCLIWSRGSFRIKSSSCILFSRLKIVSVIESWLRIVTYIWRFLSCWLLLA